MMRPKVLDRVRQQLDALKKIEDKQLVEAMLQQPRGTEAIMDYYLVSENSVSPSNQEELVGFLKNALVEEEKVKFNTAVKQHEAVVAQIEQEAKKRTDEQNEEMRKQNEVVVAAKRDAEKFQQEVERMRGLAIHHALSLINLSVKVAIVLLGIVTLICFVVAGHYNRLCLNNLLRHDSPHRSSRGDGHEGYGVSAAYRAAWRIDA